MQTLLLTGFDPFAHYQINSSWEAVKVLPDRIGSFHLAKMRLPNIFGLEGRLLLERATELKPELIILTGMDSGHNFLSVNAAARNLRYALLPDNLGQQPQGEKIITAAPAIYKATIPAVEMVAQLQQEGWPVRLAPYCGGYTCNDIFYTALEHYAGSSVQVGFLHVPLLPQMVADERQALPLEQIVATLTRIITWMVEQQSNTKSEEL